MTGPSINREFPNERDTVDSSSVLDEVRPLWEAAVEHVRKSGCGACRGSARLPQLCPDGQRLVGEVLGVLCVVPPADPIAPAAAAHFEEAVREQVAADIVRFADLMEVHGAGMPAVGRDAYYVRYAARIVRDGLAAHILPAPRDTAGENFVTELARLREELLVARADGQAAHEWADALAYKVAPAEVIGAHGDEGRLPWADALAMLTPAHEVTGLRFRVLDLQRGRGPTGKCGREQSTGAPCPDHPAVSGGSVWVELGAREDERAHLLSLLPTRPPVEQGLPNELASAWAEYGVWQQVAHALGVELPYAPGAAEGEGL